ncbi:putative WAP four-disulfide core domain 2 isoform 1, partial [Operophtera brumata]
CSLFRKSVYLDSTVICDTLLAIIGASENYKADFCDWSEMSLYCVLIASSLIASVISGQGSCPPTLPVDQCNPTCGPDISCEGKQLCCPTACGASSLIASVISGQGSCPPTLPVDQCNPTCGPDISCEGKQLCCPTACGGRCPEYPGGAWICTHTCTGDSDCPRALKCCPNRCGAMACKRPDLEDTTPPSALIY